MTEDFQPVKCEIWQEVDDLAYALLRLTQSDVTFNRQTAGIAKHQLRERLFYELQARITMGMTDAEMITLANFLSGQQ